MAQVWAAEQLGDLGFRKLIALKTIRPEFAFDAAFRSMFLDEARLASRIRHANVVEVLDLGVEGHIVFQAMTFIEGAPLSGWLNKAGASRLPLGAGVRIAIDMLRGLHAAHELCDDEGNLLGLVHRDVSPQNVLVGMDGVAKLADFGIAKAFGRSTEETTYGDVKGKLGYVAPELLDGYPATPQSDLFSAGVVLWEILTGRRLFKIRAGEDTMDARKRMNSYDPREIVPELSERLASIAMTALERDPYARFRSSLEMADALEEAVRDENLDATHRHVAAALAIDLGPTIHELRDTIRAARRGSGGASIAVETVVPVVPRVEASIDVTVGPTVTGAGPMLVDERPRIVVAPASSRSSSFLIAIALALTVLSVMGTFVLLRSRRDNVVRTSTVAGEPPATVDMAPPPTPVATMIMPSPTSEVDPTTASAVATPPPPVTAQIATPRTLPAPPTATATAAPRTRSPRGRPSTTAPPPTGARPQFESPY
jgi:serine/threonine-protein kinase